LTTNYPHKPKKQGCQEKNDVPYNFFLDNLNAHVKSLQGRHSRERGSP